jgi:hypothetical protein
MGIELQGFPLVYSTTSAISTGTFAFVVFSLFFIFKIGSHADFAQTGLELSSSHLCLLRNWDCRYVQQHTPCFCDRVLLTFAGLASNLDPPFSAY